MLKTAECVSPMHPDKICDRISDAILDECLRQDPQSRVAIETMGGHGIITITGELTTKAFVDFQKVARRIVGDKYGIQVNVVRQSPEIANGVDTGGAGDQGIMVGYACASADHIPLELWLARSLCRFIYQEFPNDGKTQVTIDESGALKTVVASFQKASKKDLEHLISLWATNHRLLPSYKVFANPAGDWDIGGFDADTGLTGRKLAVDNYGPQIPIGGGAFSGKDATKVDRSGAYKARQIAVKILEEREAQEVFVKIAYAIGVADPVMATAFIDGKAHNVLELGWTNAQLSPAGLIESLDLRKPQFEKTAEWGHFGNGFTWDE